MGCADRYHNTLQELFGESEGGKSGGQGGGQGGGQTRLALATARIMTVLQQNLEQKSKTYKDPALTQLFLMNNVHYMVRSIRK